MSYSTFTKYFLLFILLLSSFSHVTAQTCNGLPTAGSVSTSVTQACPGNVATLSLSGQSSDNGITLQWQTSPDGSNWANIGSATSDTYVYTVPNGLTYIYFRVAVTCTQSGQTAFTAAQQITLPLIANYGRLPFTEDFEGDWIHICADGQLPQPVQFGPVWQNLPSTGNSSWRREDNGIGGSWSQPDYGTYATSGSAGTAHSARFHSTYATTGMLDLYLNCNTTLSSKKLSFDYNNADGTDSLEVLLSTDGGVTFSKLYAAYTAADWTHQSVILLTSSATAILRFKGDADNGNTDIGIDNIKVEEVPVCSGTPAIGAAITSDNIICGGAVFKLSLSSTPGSIEGITYQWQSSADGTSNWNDIAGAKDSVFSTSEGATTFYRVTVSCSFSGQQIISTGVKVAIPTPMSGTYTINSAVATGGTNFSSFSDAATALHCSGVNGPVILDVKAGNGVYNEQVFIDSISGASSINTITFEGHSNTIKFSSQNHDQPGVINIKGADYITLDSLIIDATPPTAEAATRFGFGVYFTDYTNNNTIHGCTILTDSLSLDDRIGYVGILTNNSVNNNTFDGNWISGGYAGILIQGNAVNTRVTNNNLQQFYYSGFYMTNNATSFPDSLLVEGNFISRPLRNSDAAGGIFVTGVSDVKISKNRIFNINAVSENVGITFTWGNQVQNSKSYVTNNLVYNLSGIYLSGLNSKVTDNVEIAHNTIALDYTATQNGAAIDGIFVSSDGAINTTVANNLVAVNGKGAGSNHAITLASLQSGIFLNNNDYFIGSDPSNAVGLVGLNSSATLADWQAVTGAEAKSVSMDPVFDDPAQGNFKPTATDLDNRGLGLAITTDILNVTRSVSNPDIGAYEFVACHLLHGLYTIDAKAAPGTDRTYLSFNDAYDALKCGIDSAVIFNVKPGSGVYNEQLNMKTIDGSSAINTVTFKGNGETISYSSGDEFHKAVIQMYGTNHVIFDSLTIDATPPNDQYRNRFGFGVQMYYGASNNTLHACAIISDTLKDHANNMGDFEYDYMAVAILGNGWQDSVSANHNVFSNNRIMGGYCAVQIYGKAIADSFMHNDITRYSDYGLLLRDGLIDDQDITDSLVVEGNEVHHAFAGSGIVIQYANNAIISKNIVHDLKNWGCTGIITQRVNTPTPGSPQSKTMVTNNLVYDLGSDTPINYQKQVWGIVDYGGGKVYIEHNTVALTNVYFSSDKAQIWGILSVENAPAAAGDLYIRNNLVTIGGTGIAKTAGIALSTQSFIRNTYHIDFNNYYYDTTTSNNSAAYFIDSAKYYKLSDWQTITKMDSNSVTIDPLYSNAAAANYKPTSYPMDNHGDSVGIATDIIEVVRNLAHPDLGAYEYAACPGKFAGFSFDKTATCSGDPVSFTARDTTFDWQTIVTWSWDFGNGTTSFLKDPSVTFDKGGTYTIKLTATSNEGCSDDVTDVITINDCYKELFIPNTFTPNGDGRNDVLKVYGNDIKAINFMVFNQWGQKMYESNDAAVGWDGTQHGKPQPTGVYMYVCRIIMNNDREVIRKGSVNLIR